MTTKHKQNKEKYQSSIKYRLKLNIIAGGLTGLITDFICYPLETFKTRSQIMTNLKISTSFSGIYNGLTAQLLVAFPCTGMYFVFYEGTKYYLEFHSPEKYKPNLAIRSFTGAILGEIAAGIVSNPFEIIKQKMQIGQYSRLVDCIKSIKRKRGFRGFYQGLLSLLGREVPFSCLQMPIYEVIPWLLTPVLQTEIHSQQTANVFVGKCEGVCSGRGLGLYFDSPHGRSQDKLHGSQIPEEAFVPRYHDQVAQRVGGKGLFEGNWTQNCAHGHHVRDFVVWIRANSTFLYDSGYCLLSWRPPYD